MVALCFRLLKSELVASNTEALFVYIKLQKSSSLNAVVISLVNLPVRMSYNISKTLDSNIGNYDNFFVAGDFNSEISGSSTHEISSTYNLHDL